MLCLSLLQCTFEHLIYRPGSATITAVLFDEFRVLLEPYHRSIPYVITGDFNIRFDRSGDRSTLLATELLDMFDAAQCVTGVNHDRGGTLM